MMRKKYNLEKNWFMKVLMLMNLIMEIIYQQ